MARKTVYNNIVSKELWEQVSKNNKEIMKEFLEYCKSVDRSHSTIKMYEDDLKIFFVWNLQNNNNKFFVDLGKRDVMRYQSYLLNDLLLSSNRIRRLKAVISSMSNFIESMMDDLYPNFRNIINKIPAPPKEPVREKTVLTEEDVKRLLDYLVEHKKYQHACVFALAIASGSRKSELLRFKVSYFTDENIILNALYKTPEKIKTKGRGSKGKLLNKYVIMSQFKPYLDLWLEQRKELGIESDELFLNKRNEKWESMKVSTLDSYAQSFSKILGLDFYFHSNRHYFTTALCKANIPATVIKKIVGWENVGMIDHYNDSEVDEEVGKYFGEDGIKVAETKSFSEIK